MGSPVALGKAPGRGGQNEFAGGTGMALKLIHAVGFLVTPSGLGEWHTTPFLLSSKSKAVGSIAPFA